MVAAIAGLVAAKRQLSCERHDHGQRFQAAVGRSDAAVCVPGHRRSRRPVHLPGDSPLAAGPGWPWSAEALRPPRASDSDWPIRDRDVRPWWSAAWPRGLPLHSAGSPSVPCRCPCRPWRSAGGRRFARASARRWLRPRPLLRPPRGSCVSVRRCPCSRAPGRSATTCGLALRVASAPAWLPTARSCPRPNCSAPAPRAADPTAARLRPGNRPAYWWLHPPGHRRRSRPGSAG